MPQKKLSRREWFRLRTAGDEQRETTEAANLSHEGLRPIEHPPNHDGLDMSVLPPMREAVLAASQIDELFRDIAEFADDVLLMQRSVVDRSAPQTSRVTSREQLETARSMLKSGQVQRVQIRYQWQNSHWIDTLETQPNGFRLVRIEHRSQATS